MPSKSGLCPKAEPGAEPPNGLGLMEAYNQNVNYLHTVFRRGCVAYIGKASFGATRRGRSSVLLVRHCDPVVESLYLYLSAWSPLSKSKSPLSESEALMHRLQTEKDRVNSRFNRRLVERCLRFGKKALGRWSGRCARYEP